MTDQHTSTRRRYLQAAGAASLVGTTGLSGCLGSLGGGGPIPVGSLLPITGDLSDFGPGMQDGVELAVEDINDAGGVLGRELDLTNSDTETDATAAQNKYSQLVNEDEIVAFVGAASSGVSVPLAQGIAEDEVFQCSPASTSPTLADLGYSGETKYFGRTAPNDGQQGIVMGQIMNDSDYVGADTAAFLHVNNAYGEGLAKKAQEAFDGETLQLVPYSSRTSDYTSTLDQLFSGDPDAVGFVGYPESGQSILETWDQGGYGGNWVLSEGLNSTDFYESIPEIVEGMYVSSPAPAPTDGASKFEEKLGEAPPVFSPHSYDAMFLVAAAMETAGEASGTAIAQNIQSVSRPEGTKVTVGEWDTAVSELDGGNINYEGASSQVNLNANLEPLNRFAILQVQDAQVQELETIEASFFEGEL